MRLLHLNFADKATNESCEGFQVGDRFVDVRLLATRDEIAKLSAPGQSAREKVDADVADIEADWLRGELHGKWESFNHTAITTKKELAGVEASIADARHQLRNALGRGQSTADIEQNVTELQTQAAALRTRITLLAELIDDTRAAALSHLESDLLAHFRTLEADANNQLTQAHDAVITALALTLPNVATSRALKAAIAPHVVPGFDAYLPAVSEAVSKHKADMNARAAVKPPPPAEKKAPAFPSPPNDYE